MLMLKNMLLLNNQEFRNIFLVSCEKKETGEQIQYHSLKTQVMMRLTLASVTRSMKEYVFRGTFGILSKTSYLNPIHCSYWLATVWQPA
jgi:hypothetical protein